MTKLNQWQREMRLHGLRGLAESGSQSLDLFLRTETPIKENPILKKLNVKVIVRFAI